MITSKRAGSWVLLAAALSTPGAGMAMEVSFERDTTLPLVDVAVVLKTGSVADPQNLPGLTSFMGSMLKRGSGSRTKDQIDLELDQLGASLGVEVRTEAMILRGSALSRNLDRFLALIKDLIEHPAFPPAEIERYREKVISSLVQAQAEDSSLSGVWFERFLLEGHPFGEPVPGTIASLKKIARKDIENQYRALMGPSNLAIVGSGDAQPAVIQTWASGLLADRTDLKPLPVMEPPAEPRSRRLMVIDKPDRTQLWIHGGQIGIRFDDPDFFPLYLGNYAFGGNFTSRFMKEIRVERGWSYGAYSTFRFGTVPRIWRFYLFPAVKDAPAALTHTLGMIEKLRARGLSADEFEFAKKSIVSSDGFRYDTPGKRVENRILEITLKLPEGFMSSWRAEFSKLSREAVNQSLARYLAPDRLTFAILGTAIRDKKALAEAVGVPEASVRVVDYNKED
ncbi:MAG: insulinase family protein [Bdellovibrionales bacterium]|nr:insulinase family protein [Bdellovibrionales bacterium]